MHKRNNSVALDQLKHVKHRFEKTMQLVLGEEQFKMRSLWKFQSLKGEA